MENNIEQLQKDIEGLVHLSTEQTSTMKQINENCWRLLERIQAIELKINQWENPKPELEGFILSDLLNAEK